MMKVTKVEQVVNTHANGLAVKVTYSDGNDKIYYFGQDYSVANRFEHDIRMQMEDVP